MVTLCIDGGRKDKVRPGDILGALTADKALPAAKVGTIDIFDHVAYVAIERNLQEKALRILSEKPIKGCRFKVRSLK
jgi:ATP-independent RNA helicase DbpA